MLPNRTPGCTLEGGIYLTCRDTKKRCVRRRPFLVRLNSLPSHPQYLSSNERLTYSAMGEFLYLRQRELPSASVQFPQRDCMYLLRNVYLYLITLLYISRSFQAMSSSSRIWTLPLCVRHSAPLTCSRFQTDRDGRINNGATSTGLMLQDRARAHFPPSPPIMQPRL